MIEIGLALIALVTLSLMRVPIGLAAGFVGVMGYLYSLDFVSTITYIGDFIFWKLASYELWSIPLFILMGNCLGKCGLGEALFSLSRRLTGDWKGGVAFSVILGSAGLGSLCGSSIVTAITIGKVAGPVMMRRNYPIPFTTSIIAVGGNLGMIIPPSVLLILYGTLVETNITTLFQAAIIPALICIAFYVIVIINHPMLKNVETIKVKKHPPLRKDLIQLIPFLVCFLAVVSMYLGIVTVIEAAALGSFISCFLLKLKGLELKGPFLDTAKASGMIFIIILGADLLRSFLAISGLPHLMVEYVADLDGWIMFGIYIVIILILGCFMDTLSILWITLPVIWPFLSTHQFWGMDLDAFKIWFGMITLISMELGMITPPVGLNILTVQTFFPKIKLRELIKGIYPFVSGEIVRLVLIILFPSIALWLPKVLA